MVKNKDTPKPHTNMINSMDLEKKCSDFLHIYLQMDCKRDMALKSQEAQMQRFFQFATTSDLSSLSSSISSYDLSSPRLFQTILEHFAFNSNEHQLQKSNPLIAELETKEYPCIDCVRRIGNSRRPSIYEDDDLKENDISFDSLVARRYSCTRASNSISSESETTAREPHLKIVHNHSQSINGTLNPNTKRECNSDIFSQISFVQAYFECKSCGEDLRPNEILAAHIHKESFAERRWRIHMYRMADASDAKAFYLAQATSDSIYASTALGSSRSTNQASDTSSRVGATTWLLPAPAFDGLWQSLVFDQQLDLKHQLLTYIETALVIGRAGIDSNYCALNHILFLQGPPGTGKTSLCRAVAQHAAMRHASEYIKGAVLIEINSHSLFSKFFSESPKLVSQLFDGIYNNWVRDPEKLIFLLIDEVESLSIARQTALHGNEPSDALRVVNALLTEIDRFSKYPNVFLLCTSNLSGSIDEAFISRTDCIFYIGNPAAPAIYKILAGSIEELIKKKLVAFSRPGNYPEFTRFISYREALQLAVGDQSFDQPLPPTGARASVVDEPDSSSTAGAAHENNSIPSIIISDSETQPVSFQPPRTAAAASEAIAELHQHSISLLKLARCCENCKFSGRVLKKLPITALSSVIEEVVVGSIARLGGSSGGVDDGEHAGAGVELGRYLKALEHELSRQRTARERVEHEAATLSGR